MNKSAISALILGLTCSSMDNMVLNKYKPSKDFRYRVCLYSSCHNFTAHKRGFCSTECCKNYKEERKMNNEHL